MTPSETATSRRRQVLSVLGMAMIWPSIHNQVLYPLSFSFHKEGAGSPYGYYYLYSIVMLVTVLVLLFMNRERITPRLFTSKGAIVSIGVIGSAGLALLVVCDFGNDLARWFMGAGVAFSAMFVPIYFVFWSVQIVYASQKRAAFDLLCSYLIFVFLTLLRLSLEAHSWPVSIAYPLISAALAYAVLRMPSKNKYALGETPTSGLPKYLLIPSIIFVYLGTAARCLLNPINAAFDYPPFHRVLIYIILIAGSLLLLLLYRPKQKIRRSADLIGFALVTVFLVGGILFTGIGLAGETGVGNLPTIAGINLVELFIWLIVLVNAQIKHAGIVKPAAIFLVLVVGASHLCTVIALSGVNWLQFDVSQLPLIVITIALAFLVVAVVMAVMTIMLYNASIAGKTSFAGIAGSPAAAVAPAAVAAPVAAVADVLTPEESGASAPSVSVASATVAAVPSVPPCVTIATDEAAIQRIQESFGLSKRETDTLRLAARNKPAKEIAESLFVAESTVNSHIKGIYRKCDVHSRQELVALVNRFKREISG